MIKAGSPVHTRDSLQRTRSEIDALLQDTRWRIQQASMEESRLELELRMTDLELRLGEAWVLRQEGEPDRALRVLRDLKKDAQGLPPSFGHLLEEIRLLEQKLVLPKAREEIRNLLADAERFCQGGKASLAAGPLDEVKNRLLQLPNKGTYDLYEEFLRVHGLLQSVRRPALERFNVLRASFNARMATRVRELSRLSRSDRSLRPEELRNLLDHITVAQGILASLDPALIGRQDHEGAQIELREYRRVLIEHLHRSTSSPDSDKPTFTEGARPTSPSSPPLARAPMVPLGPPAPRVSSPSVPEVPAPPAVRFAPPPQEKLVLELSPWAMGSWGKLSG